MIKLEDHPSKQSEEALVDVANRLGTQYFEDLFKEVQGFCQLSDIAFEEIKNYENK